MFGVAWVLIFAGILIACLWPFEAPRNQVYWLDHGQGLRFGEYGTVVSREPLLASHAPANEDWTLELWLRPGLAYQNGTILAFYDPEREHGFSLRQWSAALVMQDRLWPEELSAVGGGLDVDGIFRGASLLFLTLASGADGTSVYVDGKFVRLAPRFRLPDDEFSGQMVIANSPVDNDDWSGEIRGLAFYRSELTAAEVLRHYASWTRTGTPEIAPGDGSAALFLFNEGSGNIVHNQVPSAASLYIPERYLEVHHALLKRPWNEYRVDSDYWTSAVINIMGFAPLGFFLYGYLFLRVRVPRAALLTILIGGLLSLTVEILQSFLPTRDSGMTDIFTNTLGTALGAALCRGTSIVCDSLVNSRYLYVRHFAGLFTHREPQSNRIEDPALRNS